MEKNNENDMYEIFKILRRRPTREKDYWKNDWDCGRFRERALQVIHKKAKRDRHTYKFDDRF